MLQKKKCLHAGRQLQIPKCQIQIKRVHSFFIAMSGTSVFEVYTKPRLGSEALSLDEHHQLLCQNKYTSKSSFQMLKNKCEPLTVFKGYLEKRKSYQASKPWNAHYVLHSQGRTQIWGSFLQRERKIFHNEWRKSRKLLNWLKEVLNSLTFKNMENNFRFLPYLPGSAV